MKKYFYLFIVFIVLMNNHNNVLGFDVNWDDDSAKVGYIHQREYYDTVLELIHKAKKSIVMQMYFMDSTKRGDDPIVFKLVDSLVKAKNREVKVKVILENDVLLNNRAYTYLMKNGVETYWDHDTQTTHSKLIVIDERLVIVGSTNWSERAFRMNNEASVLIESEKVAKTVLAELSKQKVLDISGADDKTSKDVIYIPENFILNKKCAPKMISASAERAFDLYLVILYLSQENSEKPAKTKVTIDYERIAQYFGNLDEKGMTNFQRGIRKELTKLEKKYKLIRWEREHGKLPEIELLTTLKKRESIAIPRKFWEAEFSRKLSHTANFMYLINLYETSVSSIQPWWSMTQKELVKKYHVKKWTISKGNRELGEKNIIEIKYARTARDKRGDFAMRRPNKYKVNDLMTDEEKKDIYKTLGDEYGEELLERARIMAISLDEPHDPLVIETILDLIQIYGVDKVESAVAVPA